VKKRSQKITAEVKMGDLLEFQNKWADYLKDEVELDLKPIAKLDPEN